MNDEEVPPWTLGWRLQRALSWADMTTEEMSYELGVARSTVSRWCNDKGHPTRGYLKLWALRTRVPLNWLVQGDSGLPRVDSNHQPADMGNDLRIPRLEHATYDESAPRSRNAAELLAIRTALPIHWADLHHSPDHPSTDQVVAR